MFHQRPFILQIAGSREESRHIYRYTIMGRPPNHYFTSTNELRALRLDSYPTIARDPRLGRNKPWRRVDGASPQQRTAINF